MNMGLITNAVTNSTSGIISGLNAKFDGITSVAKGILCLPQLLNPAKLKGLTANVGKMLTAYASNVVTGLANFVTATVTRNIQNVTGAIGEQLNKINNFISDIKESIQLIKTTAKALVDKAKNTWDFLTDTENCSFAAAELGKCIISDILDDIPRSVSKQLSEGTLDLNNRVRDITEGLTAPGRAITGYINQAQTLANRASIQQRF